MYDSVKCHQWSQAEGYQLYVGLFPKPGVRGENKALHDFQDPDQCSQAVTGVFCPNTDHSVTMEETRLCNQARRQKDMSIVNATGHDGNRHPHPAPTSSYHCLVNHSPDLQLSHLRVRFTDVFNNHRHLLATPSLEQVSKSFHSSPPINTINPF